MSPSDDGASGTAGPPRRGTLGAMPSEKRQRQRANRMERRAREARAARRRQAFAIVKRYTLYAVLFGTALVLLTLFFGR